MISDLEVFETKAVDAAINLDWKEAIGFNMQIIKLNRQNLAAYLRIGYAYLQLNKIRQSKEYYQKALKIQPKSSVALDNLERIKVLEARKGKERTLEKIKINPSLFIEIPGKTKTVALVNHGQKNVLAKLLVGQEVKIRIKRRKVEVRTFSNEYIGNLPDDLSRRLISFIKAKSRYITYIKEASLTRVVIFIKEDFKGKQIANHISFPLNIQQNIENLTKEDSSETEDEGNDDLEDNWDKLLREVKEDEKEIITGIQTEEPEEEEQ